jgi:hypothetical protein
VADPHDALERREGLAECIDDVIEHRDRKLGDRRVDLVKAGLKCVLDRVGSPFRNAS